MERLQKILAAAGVASRREAEGLISSGAVTVNGRQARLGESADPARDEILLRGRPLPSTRKVYVALDKPLGYVSSLRSTHGEPTVTELVDLPERLVPVGRLDKDTSGLLFLTNDGDWANVVTHPRYRVEKEYRVTVRGRPSGEALTRLRSGITLPDGTVTAPAVVTVSGRDGGDTVLKVVVGEGKKRQIRLMFAAVGYPVVSLRRVRIGPVVVGDLSAGRWRYLRPEEVEAIGKLRDAGGESRREPTERGHRRSVRIG